MSTDPIPFINKQESGSDELSGAQPLAMNVVVDQSQAVRRRPGIRPSQYVDPRPTIGSEIIGLWAALDGAIYAVDKTTRSLWRVLPNRIDLVVATADIATLDGTGNPVFAETESLLVYSGGGAPQKYRFATGECSRLGGTPPSGTHVVANSSRLLLNRSYDYLGMVQFSGLASGGSFAGFEQWGTGVGTAGYFNTEAKPDPCVALAVLSNEIICLGSTTIQSFSPDASAGYVPVASRENGCGARYSVIKDDSNVAFLDNLRRFVVSDTRTSTPISVGIKGDMDQMATVEDCWGFRCVTNSLDGYVWKFPSDGRTFAYQKEVGWGQWSSGATEHWRPLDISAHCIHPTSGANIVGTVDGYIGQLDLDCSTDFGAPFSAYVVTGYQNRKTEKRKLCNGVTLYLRRGTGTSQTGTLRWRDKPGPWTGSIPFDLAGSTDTEPHIRFRALGTYRTRQWGFEFSGSSQLILVGATEDYTVLEF
jgi:hypothetical protein